MFAVSGYVIAVLLADTTHVRRASTATAVSSVGAALGQSLADHGQLLLDECKFSRLFANSSFMMKTIEVTVILDVSSL
jgi:hypothetical protein